MIARQGECGNCGAEGGVVAYERVGRGRVSIPVFSVGPVESLKNTPCPGFHEFLCPFSSVLCGVVDAVRGFFPSSFFVLSFCCRFLRCILSYFELIHPCFLFLLFSEVLSPRLFRCFFVFFCSR